MCDAFQFAPRVLHQMKDLIELHNPGKFFEDSSFDSNFRDLQKLAQQSFWIYFGWLFNEFL